MTKLPSTNRQQKSPNGYCHTRIYTVLKANALRDCFLSNRFRLPVVYVCVCVRFDLRTEILETVTNVSVVLKQTDVLL